jgi:nicotinate phosphoribosyltransferase
VLAARAAYIGGCLGTSNVRAGQLFNIPTYGTQAHSWIMAHEREEEAFAQFMDIFPNHSVLLLDTYDVRAALEKVIAIGRKPRGVRLDSGDLAADSRWARQRLDEAGWGDVEIFMSGDLDEERISSLLDAGARVDTFGVGTSLSTSSDAPSLSVLYKLVELARGSEVREAAKFSAAKVTYPGRKQVYREIDSRGEYAGDVIALEGEQTSGEPLLVAVLRAGQRIGPAVPLAELQKRCQSQIERLPAAVRGLAVPNKPYTVRHSSRLEALLEQVRERVARTVTRS